MWLTDAIFLLISFDKLRMSVGVVRLTLFFLTRST